jgi:predicted ATPase
VFKHALVQDAAYETLLRSRRAALHGAVAAVLERDAEVAAVHPALLAHHFAEAGLIEKAAEFWSKAGQRSLSRSALIEATEQLTRALTQIAALPSTPTLRREQIELQIGLANAQMQTKGYAAPDTKASLAQARLLIEDAEARGESAGDKLVRFSVLYGFWVTNPVAFNGDALRNLAVEFLAIAKDQKETIPLMIGHRLVGTSFVLTGDLTEGRAHLDRAIALYVPNEHRSLATRFAMDVRVSILASRTIALCVLGHPEAARTDAADALEDAREVGHAPTLMTALFSGAVTHVLCRDYLTANAQLYELVALADNKGSPFWKTLGMTTHGCVSTLVGQLSDGVAFTVSSIAAYRSTGSSHWMPLFLSILAGAHAQLDRFDDAWRCIDEAMTAVETTRERWIEADIHRLAGEIELMSPEPDATKAESYFRRALEIARGQQALFWELRAATSLARLWQAEGRAADAHSLLAPLYDSFTEGS